MVLRGWSWPLLIIYFWVAHLFYSNPPHEEIGVSELFCLKDEEEDDEEKEKEEEEDEEKGQEED